MHPFHPADPDYAGRVRENFARQQIMAHLGAEIAAVAPGRCEIRLPFRRKRKNN